MDAIIGRVNFRNEIIWGYPGPSQPRNAFKRKHDIIFFYAKSKYAYFSDEGSSEPISDFSKSKFTLEDEKGKYKEIRNKKTGKIYRAYLRTHQRMRDIWEIPVINAMAKERVGYPTQKPLKLLRRIIRASSDDDAVVLDPFCGCATACVAAERLGRQWVGIDLSAKAAELVKTRIAQDNPLLFSQHPLIHRTDIPKRTDQGELPNYRTHKHLLFGEQEGRCAGCEFAFPFRNFQIDHKVPRSKGGSDHYENLQLLCAACNAVKGDRDQAYLIARLGQINGQRKEINA